MDSNDVVGAVVIGIFTVAGIVFIGAVLLPVVVGSVVTGVWDVLVWTWQHVILWSWKALRSTLRGEHDRPRVTTPGWHESEPYRNVKRWE